MASTTEHQSLLKTPLYDLHLASGAKMVPFAGYDMPVQYGMGVKKEHLHTREAAGLFDVSHMGQIMLTSDDGSIDTITLALEQLVPVDVVDLPEGKQKYAFFTNEHGGILDDLMVANLERSVFVVVNAACKHRDIAHMKKHLPSTVDIEVLEDRALMALQGPKAAAVLSAFAPEVAEMLFMDIKSVVIQGIECLVSRSGYTGEDGYEISVASDQATELANLLLTSDHVALIGLGARDSLRLECGLCLYGHDLDETTTPVEASLLWAIGPVRRLGGARAGGFIGDAVILSQIEQKHVSRKRVGLIGQSKAPVREGTELYDAEGQKVGVVTSGTSGPTIGQPVSMAYVETAYAALDTELYANVRGKMLPMTIAKMPFVPQRYYRGQ